MRMKMKMIKMYKNLIKKQILINYEINYYV